MSASPYRLWQHATAFVLAMAASAVLTSVGCSAVDTMSDANGEDDLHTKKDAGAAEDDPPCTLCVNDGSCHGGAVCAQHSGDTFCAAKCSAGHPCGSGSTCTHVTTSDGQSAEVCVPTADVCGPTPAPPTGTPGAPPSSLGGVTGTVGPNGGTLSRLHFAVVGDTRPPIINDTRGYPSAVIDKIYSDIAALNPRPAFVVTSGDYQFSTGNGTQAAPQLDLYLAARAHYPGTVFAALGNHECDGNTTSNCGTGNKSGVTANYTAFIDKLLAPIGKTKPYYEVDVDGTNGAWTAKFLFVAANAWDAAQAQWLATAMARPTTYTFIVRHEPSQATTAPGVTPSEQIMAQHPYTLAIVGHTHTYGKTGPRQVTIGNGGAPLVSGGNFGFGLLSQRPDGAIQVDMVDYATGNTDAAFHFAVHPDGSPAAP